MHNKTIQQALRELDTSDKGLSGSEASERIKKYGLNEIKEGKKISPWQIFLNQFKSIVIWILIIATVISAFLKEYIDAIVILIIIILIAVLGFVQEYRAERAIEALKKLASLKATVLRDNQKKDIDSRELVPGDIIILETGDKVPADARLIEVFNLQAQEAALTGESQPVKKTAGALEEKIGIADMKNMVFSGTIIVSGRAKAVVASTGMHTEIGKIAKLIEEVKIEPTHLQKKLDQLGRLLALAVVIIAVIVFAVGIILHEASWIDMLIVSVSLAVAAIPEGLPAVVTISLAIGTKKMLKRNALVRRLPSVETLGATTVICTDKTGTLTANEMTVKKLFVNGRIIDVTGVGYETKGRFLYKNKAVPDSEVELLLKIGILNNNSDLKDNNVIGDPTEAALIVSAAKIGLIKEELDIEYRRIDEIEFTSERKMMTTIHGHHGENISYVKGAPEVVLSLCNFIFINGKAKKLTNDMKNEILEVTRQFGEDALRVLGFAYKTVTDTSPEKNLIFVGLQGMMDPPREGINEAIAKCRKAGIKVIMITGDHEVTAKAVAKEIGLAGKAITGQHIGEIKNLEDWVEDIAIFARVNPEHKIKIVDALKKKGHVVAMTGDGVNDAPALKKADIGIAMGITGTDVSKEASAMILTDDNFASIVNAVEEGRGIYDNIKKYVEYLLSSNLGEILTIFIGIVLGMPLPVIAIQILWINLVTDGLPALALSVDPNEPNIMSRPPRNPKEGIITRFMTIRMFITGFLMMFITLMVFSYYNEHFNLIYAQTMAFTVLMIIQMFNVLNTRSEKTSVLETGLFSNIYLWLAIGSSILLQLIVIYTPLSRFFKTSPLSLLDWALVVAVSSSVLIVGELAKYANKRIETRHIAT